jgi:hypothetical protein
VDFVVNPNGYRVLMCHILSLRCPGANISWGHYGTNQVVAMIPVRGRYLPHLVTLSNQLRVALTQLVAVMNATCSRYGTNHASQ